MKKSIDKLCTTKSREETLREGATQTPQLINVGDLRSRATKRVASVSVARLIRGHLSYLYHEAMRPNGMIIHVCSRGYFLMDVLRASLFLQNAASEASANVVAHIRCPNGRPKPGGHRWPRGDRVPALTGRDVQLPSRPFSWRKLPNTERKSSGAYIPAYMRLH